MPFITRRLELEPLGAPTGSEGGRLAVVRIPHSASLSQFHQRAEI